MPIWMILAGIFLLSLYGYGSSTYESGVTTLENGIPAVFEVRPDSPLIHLVVALRAGSKYETHSSRGISHLIEHLILFGGQGPDTARVTEELQSRGGHVNGHTDRDLVTLELTLPLEDLEFATRIMGKLVFNRRFFQADLDRERRIVEKEMGEAVDDPERQGLFIMLKHLFSGHPYERSAFGDPKSLGSITLEDIQAHYQALFVPERSAVALVGGMNSDKARECLQSGLGICRKADVPGQPLSRGKIVPLRPLVESIEMERTMNVQRAHIWMGFRAPAYNDDQRVAMRVLCQMLGQGGYPLLSTRFSGRFRLVDSISMSYLPLEDGGCTWVHMVLERDNIRRALNEWNRFLKQFRSMNFSRRDFPPSQRRHVYDFMETAGNQLLLRSEVAGEDGLQRALTYARFILLNKKSRPRGFGDQLSDLSPSRLRRLAVERLLKPPHVVVTVLPEAAP